MTIKAKSLAAWAEAVLGHVFADIALLEEALTHPSVGGRASYQRLEFLGDRVLGLVISDALLEAFPDEAEGVIARRFVRLVRRETLADVATDIGLSKHIRTDTAARQAGVHEQDGVRADVMEAVIGALYKEGGLEAAKAFILPHWTARTDPETGASKDPKTRLQEWAQGRGLELPDYKIVERGGPDHAPEFTIEVVVSGYEPARATAGSKRDAQKAAAEALWQTMTMQGESS